MEKTLYISDLDGTLLNREQKVSRYSEKVISSLIEKGMMFTYATARSLVSASVITEGLPIKIPVILNNGVRTVDPTSGKIIFQKSFSEEKFFFILSFLRESGIAPIVYYSLEGRDRFSYVPSLINEETKAFLGPKKEDGRNIPVDSTVELYSGIPYYFVCIGEDEKIFSAYEALKKVCACVTYIDIYSGHRWLEIMPDGASKAEAALSLKEYLGAEKLVVFGDGGNDISMFEVSDECYAVANADERLRKMACAVIDSNESDGVAGWLRDNAAFLCR